MPSNNRRCKTRGRRRTRSPSPTNHYDEILKRLQVLEHRSRIAAEPCGLNNEGAEPDFGLVPGATPSAPAPSTSTYATSMQTPELPLFAGGQAPVPTPQHGNASNTAERLLEVLNSVTVRSNHYYVSDFDPNIHDVDTWCDEIDKACILNRWDDKECLARVGHCLKGESCTWLSQWTSTIRTWSNFKAELKALCPRGVDVANILFEVMCTESNKYTSYAEYARKSLLKLRIVKGLSSELVTSIIIRGITDPQIRASAKNAKLSPENIVEFLSNFVKCISTQRMIGVNSQNRTNISSSRNLKRNQSLIYQHTKCYECKRFGHKSVNCPKKIYIESNFNNSVSSNLQVEKCNFCKKLGHLENKCFAKDRAESRNKNGVNFCQENEGMPRRNDVIIAVILGIPIDVLIDSGSCVSLISTEVVKHFSCQIKHTYLLLHGLGNMEIEVKSMITLPVELNDITLEIDFYIVSNKHLNVPAIIGTDVLNRRGVAYIRTSDSQRIVHKKDVYTIVQSNPNLLLESINTPATGGIQKRLTNLLSKYLKYFLTDTATTTVKGSEMQIKLTSDVPIYYRPYKLSHDEKLRLRTIIKDLLKKEIIRESDSEYASPVLLIKKKDGTDRLVVDYRALNQITVKVRHPLPLINDCVDRLGTANYFSALDMVSGFHQLRVSEDSIHKTAFITPEGHYEYCKMPFGLANAPAIYQKTITKTLKSFIEAGKVLVYIDDVLLLTDTAEENLILLDLVLKTLTEAGFSINVKKCIFLTEEVEYLGRIISHGQVRPSQNKIEALVKSPPPENVKQVRQFLGLAGYFRRYISGYAIKTACIAALTKKNVTFNWGEEQEKMRQEIITRLTTEPVLAIFNPELLTELYTDASSIGYGGILMQIQKDKRKRVVAYFSKLTVGAESKYHSYELETLAVVKSMQHFRQYLIGKHFKLITDCNALKLTQRKKDLQPRVARWWIYMQDFDFTLEYRKGVLMSHVDYLSRNPVNIVDATKKPRNWAQIAQAGDEEVVTLLEKVNNGDLDCKRYLKRNDILYYKYIAEGEDARYLCYVPKAYRLSLLRIFHDEHEHIGIDKTIDLILKHFWFPSIRKFVIKYISHCIICITQKLLPRAPLQPITSWQKVAKPFDTVHADVLGPIPECNGYKYILILVDAFTKYSLLYALYRQDCNELKRVLTNIISLFGTFNRLVCDRNKMFDNNEFINWTKMLGVEVFFITPGMHQENGQVERYCRTVLNMIRIEVNRNKNTWSDVLWKLQLVLNITKHKTTQCSALNLLIGTNSTTPIINALIRDITCEGSNPNQEAMRELHRQRAEYLIKENKEKQDSYVNKHRITPRKFHINDSVFVIKNSQSTGKLDSGMRGPYKVIKVLSHDRYELRLLGGSYGKTTQAAARYMVLWRGEWTPDTCAIFFDC